MKAITAALVMGALLAGATAAEATGLPPSVLESSPLFKQEKTSDVAATAETGTEER